MLCRNDANDFFHAGLGLSDFKQSRAAEVQQAVRFGSVFNLLAGLDSAIIRRSFGVTLSTSNTPVRLVNPEFAHFSQPGAE